MKSTLQTREIHQYLLGKNLPLDIIAEVEDHFSQQINDLQVEKNLSFSEAFSLVKKDWKDDLEMIYPWYVINRNGENMRTRFEQKYCRQMTRPLLGKAMLLSLVILIVIMIFYYLDKIAPIIKTINYVILGLLIANVVVMFYNMMRFSLFKAKFENVKISAFQAKILFFFTLANLLQSTYGRDYFNDLPIALQSKEWTSTLTWETFGIFTLIFVGFYTLLNQLKYTQTLFSLNTYLKTI